MTLHLGNHDYGYGAKGIQAQLDRSLIDDYWSFKSTNYSKTYDIPNGGTVIIVFVDTTTLAPSVNKCCNENGLEFSASLLFLYLYDYFIKCFCTLISWSFVILTYRGISTAVQATRIENQLRHIDAMLDAASQKEPTWLLVAGHYPIFSIGEHGDNSELQSYLQPLLRRYNVDAYFCGHDHLSEVPLQSHNQIYYHFSMRPYNSKLYQCRNPAFISCGDALLCCRWRFYDGLCWCHFKCENIMDRRGIQCICFSCSNGGGANNHFYRHEQRSEVQICSHQFKRKIVA